MLCRKGSEMGQIANQMFIEWCCKVAQKIGVKKNSSESICREKKCIPESSDQKDRKRRKGVPGE